MDVIRNLFPGIVSVECFDSTLLPDDFMDIPDIISMKISIPDERIDIPLIEPGTCEVQYKDGAESLSLKFSAQMRINPRFRPAFLFKDANGDTFVIASKYKPFPKLTMLRTSGSVPDARPEVSYEITHTAVHTPIAVAISDT